MGAASTDVSTPLDLIIVNASQAFACTQMAGPALVSHRFKFLENLFILHSPFPTCKHVASYKKCLHRLTRSHPSSGQGI